MSTPAKLPGYGRLLDAWTAPEGAGEPVGCIATSFTFDPVFFEEECLGRFLRLESDPTEDGPIYLLEREEKLAQVACAAAIVDAHHCRGSRSLRWDLFPARIAKGILHAKVSLLLWTDHLRLIVASANLTEDGYRRNQEVFGLLDFRAGAEGHPEAVQALLELLRWLCTSGAAGGGDAAIGRVTTLLDRAATAIASWSIRPVREVVVHPVIVRPGQPSAIEQLAAAWRGGAPTDGHVVSPFFDVATAAVDRPTQAVWQSLLRRRGAATLWFYVQVEPVPGEDKILVHAPASLRGSGPQGRPEASIGFARLALEDHRPLHAKLIWLESAQWSLYCLGSSNFTSPGLGLGGGQGEGAAYINVEANLAYRLDRERYPKLQRQLEAAFPDTDDLSVDDATAWLPAAEAGVDEPADDDLALPRAFRAAVYDVEAEGTLVRLTLEQPPAGWALTSEADGAGVIDEAAWASRGSPDVLSVPWTAARAPSGFWVTWTGAAGRAWWPVTVDSPDALPTPEELRDLPLEVLVDILTAARPLHRIPALRRHLRAREAGTHDGRLDPELDPHRRVDTTGFLLQRVRRTSWALSCMRERLQAPFISESALWWRLRGPVGVQALVDAVLREARMLEERAFVLAELALELWRVVPASRDGCLGPEAVRAHIEALARELVARFQQEMQSPAVQPGTAIGDYLQQVVEVIDA
jgi:hypothetical protein